MTHPTSRRHFLQAAATAAGALIFNTSRAQSSRPLPAADEGISFFLIGDTHYLAEQENPEVLDEVSELYTSKLVEWLNRLPGTAWPATVGGGSVPVPRGVIHAGDLIDSGDKADATHVAMQKTELAALLRDFGVNGGDGKLRWPVHEVYGNHDAPQGKGLVLDAMRERNQKRQGVKKISPNGVHHSWDWEGVHFVNAGIVVGSERSGDLHGRYAHLDSLDFLVSDLAENVGNSGRPVVVTHHIDVARYSPPSGDAAKGVKIEWHSADVAAYHEALRGYRVAGVFYGHTHVRRVFPWDGRTPAKGDVPSDAVPNGIPVFNTAKASHFNSSTQGLFHFQITDQSLIGREFTTKDGWETGTWTPQVWQFALPG